MPKNKGKGGKNRKRGKNEADDEKESWSSRRTGKNTHRCCGCSGTGGARRCASTGPSGSATSGERCTRRCGLPPGTSSSSGCAITRTTRPTSSSSTCPTRPGSSRPTVNYRRTPVSTRVSPAASTTRTRVVPTTTSSSRTRILIRYKIRELWRAVLTCQVSVWMKSLRRYRKFGSCCDGR